ncbi:MAG: cytochrome c biogenesis protein CcsA [Planctomycetaceae bacterium]|nr:cytochrome c biogenesis protein CcsA [Planctomycetaceae bacterium]
MSTLQDLPATSPSPSRIDPSDSIEISAMAARYLKPLASLKLSVVLFALGIFLVLVGTLAQVEKDIWEVVSGYFRCWFAWIEFKDFFPKTWVPTMQKIPGGFWFPGGWTIGGLMTLNLLAAHSLRFKVQASGQRLMWGGIVTLLGIVLTWAVIEFGTGRDAIYETANFSADQYWNILCYGLLIPALGCGIAASKHASDRGKRVEFWTYAILHVLFLATALFLIFGGDAVRLNNSAMRIMWQLIQATFAGGVLLGGCLLLFRKRAGIVLLHAGVVLLMANELVVHQLHEEANLILAEGDTSNYVQDIRTSELVFIDASDAMEDVQTVIPAALLLENESQDEPLRHAELPFDVKVRQFFANADLKRRAEGDDNPATFGLGSTHTIVPLKKSAGTESAADYPAAYVDLIDKQTGQVRETALVSALAASIDQIDTVSAGTRELQLALRFKRNYKPFSINLIDVRKDDYIGTNTPMNYSSEIRLVDETRKEDRRVKIWMNNPLRYAGETFYQSGYQKVGNKEVTTLQVVRNEGWMIPYVACMIVAIGMLYQFGLTLLRFLDRVVNRRIVVTETPGAVGGESRRESRALGYLPAALLVGICGYWLAGLAKVPRATDQAFDLYAFGQLPVAYEGRIQPVDTLARNVVRILSNRETIKPEPHDTQASPEKGTDEKTISATQWLLELATSSPEAFERPVIRVDNDEVLSTLGLERRKSHRYTLAEIEPGIQKLVAAVGEAHELQKQSPELLSVYQRKVLELERKLGLVDLLSRSFLSPPIDPTRGNVSEQMKFALSSVRSLDERTPPLLIPPVPELTRELEPALQRNDWETYSKAFLLDILYSGGFRVEANPFSSKFAEIVMAFQGEDPAAFNKLVREYLGLVKERRIEKVDADKLAFEAHFNSFSPFFWPAFIYLLAFVLAVGGWLLPAALRPLNRASLALILMTFLLHTWAIWARIHISGRPPVTNLYSSAVFIGWAVVLMGIAFESIYKLGIGNVLAGVAGFASLWIAHGLAGDGDTFKVLQAVLDTQFWLSTHVVCVTLGYAATYVAGLLGVIYVFRGNPLSAVAVLLAVASAVLLQHQEGIPLLVRNLGPFLLAIPLALVPMYLLHGASRIQLPEWLEKNLSRMIYGTLCFALWFSFVGTVLGGLWADDSWGRFWGWDPKENGALIIVLWNALVLHARWDKLVKDRGLALLAIAGNITTSWSWFGVNELGVGLHSYGFTDGVLFYLSLFVFSQLALIVIGGWGRAKSVSTPA